MALPSQIMSILLWVVALFVSVANAAMSGFHRLLKSQGAQPKEAHGFPNGVADVCGPDGPKAQENTSMNCASSSPAKNESTTAGTDGEVKRAGTHEGDDQPNLYSEDLKTGHFYMTNGAGGHVPHARDFNVGADKDNDSRSDHTIGEGGDEHAHSGDISKGAVVEKLKSHREHLQDELESLLLDAKDMGLMKTAGQHDAADTQSLPRTSSGLADPLGEKEGGTDSTHPEEGLAAAGQEFNDAVSDMHAGSGHEMISDPPAGNAGGQEIAAGTPESSDVAAAQEHSLIPELVASDATQNYLANGEKDSTSDVGEMVDCDTSGSSEESPQDHTEERVTHFPESWSNHGKLKGQTEVKKVLREVGNAVGRGFQKTKALAKGA